VSPTSSAPPYSCILFDLDGTILDSAPCIVATLAFTFEKLGRPIPSPSVLLAFVGPPILDSFRDLAGLTPVEGLHALSIYREQYLKTGIFDAKPYPQIAGVLHDIHASQKALSLATSKPEYPATVMLKHFHLLENFDVITGASEDESRSAKGDVVAEALKRLASIGADISRPVMVGDRGTDVRGAMEHGVPTIFVSWGYGTIVESSDAVAVADSPAELHDLLLERA
jgi:phosphoglycolate phosphatase